MSVAKLFTITLLLLAGITKGLGQDPFRTTTGLIDFNASTPIEDIQASNKQVNAILKPSGDFAVVLLVREFQFPRKLMQEHFNENYLESDTYPKSYFLGEIVGFSPETPGDSSTQVTIKGKLQLHGVTKQVTVSGNIKRIENGIRLESQFTIRPEDYAIDIPKLMFKKIAEEVTVRFDFLLVHTP